jgi:hypothetical protein
MGKGGASGHAHCDASGYSRADGSAKCSAEHAGFEQCRTARLESANTCKVNVGPAPAAFDQAPHGAANCAPIYTGKKR